MHVAHFRVVCETISLRLFAVALTESRTLTIVTNNWLKPRIHSSLDFIDAVALRLL